ncbi:MAG: HEAT repeat domain-containing protein [Bryobacteraceae bacterium]
MIKLWLLVFTACIWAAPVDDARQALTDAARSKEGDQRREAALALSLVPAKDPVVNLLDRLVTDKDYQVRVATVDTLGELNDKSRVTLVKSALNDEVPEVVFAAAKALYNLRDPAGVEALQSIYEGEMRGRSNYFKKEMRDSWRRLRTPRSAFLFAVQNGVGFVPVPGVGAGYNALMGILSDSEFSARAVSLLTVCKTPKNRTCNEMLSIAFDDDDWTVRAAAIYIVTTGRLTAMKPEVANLIADRKSKVRLRAAAGYLRMESTRVAKPQPIRKLNS